MNKAKNFRQLNQELEEIISSLQSGDLDVDEILEKYQQGSELIAQLEKYLSEAQNKINKLKTTKK